MCSIHMAYGIIHESTGRLLWGITRLTQDRFELIMTSDRESHLSGIYTNFMLGVLIKSIELEEAVLAA